MTLELLAALTGVSAVAGFVDTLAGGGGMLTVPALLFAGLPPAAALATNKLQATFGSVSAALYFFRRGKITLKTLAPALAICTLGGLLGSFSVQLLGNRGLKTLIPVLLFAIALVFLLAPKLGSATRPPRLSRPAFLMLAVLPIAFYDGFLGPGTGSFFLMALVTLRGHNLQSATMTAKACNGMTNLAALALFIFGGQIFWSVGLAMALGQLFGARLASGLVLADTAARIIRPAVIAMSLLMTAVLILRNGSLY